jgi:DnaJ-class molecular chaperone
MCSACHGSGYLGFIEALGPALANQSQKCEKCHGRKKCTTCRGSGMVYVER